MKTRRPAKVTSRTSSVTNAFVQAIMPHRDPMLHEMNEVLRFFDQTMDSLTCVYCGGRATDWDHLRPLVRNSRPTGYFSTAKNLVPACGTCNQSKSGADWRTWISSQTAKGSPRSRGIQDISVRIARLEAFEEWGHVVPTNLSEHLPDGMLDEYFQKLAVINELMHEAQSMAAEIKRTLNRVIWK